MISQPEYSTVDDATVTRRKQVLEDLGFVWSEKMQEYRLVYKEAILSGISPEGVLFYSDEGFGRYIRKVRKIMAKKGMRP
jgi:hypothetical protein